MKLLPRSLYGRLLALSALATLAALIFAAFAIGQVLERFVTQGLDQRLDAQIVALGATVLPDGMVDTGRLPAIPSGWRWRIVTPRTTMGSLDPGVHAPILPEDEDDRESRHHHKDRHGPRPADLRDLDGTRLHARSLVVQTAAGPATITAAAPRAIVDRPIRAAMTPLLVSLLLLGVALAIATLVQLRIGLRPLRALRGDVARIRIGKADQLPASQPHELQPLTAEINALLAENRTALATARASAANLAHGLKTPLATLTLAVSEPGNDPNDTLAPLVERIDRTIRHHLARARSAVAGETRVSTPLGSTIEDLAATLAHIHQASGIAATQDIAAGLAVAMDANDLTEMAGNLLDNAYRWAKTRVRIAARADGNRIALTISDDGPGIPAEARAAATRPGHRLDERGDSHGFGLSIVREIAELHGGTLMLDKAAEGGLAATVTLPRIA